MWDDVEALRLAAKVVYYDRDNDEAWDELGRALDAVDPRTASPFDGSCDHRDIRTFYTSELDYLVAMRKRYACANCGTATGECSSCQRTRERIEELSRA